MSVRFRTLRSLILVTAFCSASLAQAENSNISYVGVFGGTTIPSNGNAAFSIGFSSSYKIFGRIGAGLFIQRYGIGSEITASATTDTATSSQSQLLVGADLHFFPGGSLDGFDLGLRLGLSSLKQSVVASGPSGSVSVSESSTGVFVSPKIGYDAHFGRFSAGGEFAYTFATVSSFSIQVCSKFWF